MGGPVVSGCAVSGDVGTQLTQLASLLSAGQLTQAEFDAAKSQLLGVPLTTTTTTTTTTTNHQAGGYWGMEPTASPIHQSV